MKTLCTLAFCLFTLHYISAQELQIKEIPTTTIKFEQEKFNFGTLKQGSQVKNVFRFKNTGKHPLVISDARGSCGCTIPEWPKEPILPGKSAYLIAVFDSSNKEGMQMKRITITANTDPQQSYLTISGEVVLSSETIAVESELKSKMQKIDADYFSISPNPASDKIKIKNKKLEKENGFYEIYGSDSKLVYKFDVKDETSHEVDIRSYANGTYTLVLQLSDQMRLAKQFVIAH